MKNLGKYQLKNKLLKYTAMLALLSMNGIKYVRENCKLNLDGIK